MDSSPAFGSMTAAQPRDVLSRYGIGGTSMPAFNASEGIAVWSVPPVDCPAARTRSARVAGINGDKRDTDKSRLVGQEEPQLSERPTAMRTALRLTNRYPLANAGQILNGNTALGVFSLPYDVLANAMVHVSREPRFFPPSLHEKPLGRFRSLRLKLGAQPGMTLTQIGDMRAAVVVSVVIGGDVLESEVNTEVFGGVTFGNVANVDGHEQEELAVAIDQVGLPARSIQARPLISAADPRHDLPAVVGQQRNAVGSLPRQDALVIDDRAMCSERRLNAFIPFVGFDHLGDRAHRHLGAQAEVTANAVVSQLLKLNLVRAFVGERYCRQRVAGSVEPFHRPEKDFGLFRGRQKLELHGQVHAHLYRECSMRKQLHLRCKPLSLPMAKARGISRHFW